MYVSLVSLLGEEGPPPIATAFHLARSQSKHRALLFDPAVAGMLPHFARHGKPEQPFVFVLVETFESERARHRRDSLATAVVAILLFLDTAPDKHEFSVVLAFVLLVGGCCSSSVC